MKILFVIGCMGQGRGGHFHSLNHISRNIASKAEVKIISIGIRESFVIKSNPYFFRHISFNGLNVIALRKGVKDVLSIYDADIIHFFDDHVYNVVKPFLKQNKYGLVVNRCGGPNPSDFPKVEYLVLFSKENQIWFAERPKYKNTRVKLIPNRVSKINIDNQFPIQKDLNSFCFVRIARIGEAYIKSFKDTVNLLSKLRPLIKKPLKLYIIGSIENQEIYNKLVSFVDNDPGIVLITDDEFTKEASKLLYLADAVVATGRGVMEGTSIGLPVLTPALNSDVPMLVTKQNFDNFFNTNFSQRNIASKNDINNNLNYIEKLINNDEYKLEISNNSFLLFSNNFDVSQAFEKYNTVYTDAILNKNCISRFADKKLKLRSIYYFYLNSKKV